MNEEDPVPRMIRKDAPKSVPEILRAMASTYEQRNALYGNNYKRIGLTFVTLFPEGLTVRTADEWNRLFVLLQIVGKVSRHTAQWKAGGHQDSLHDAAVYAAMAEELMMEERG